MPCDTFGNCFDTSLNTIKHAAHTLSYFKYAIVKYTRQVNLLVLIRVFIHCSIYRIPSRSTLMKLRIMPCETDVWLFAWLCIREKATPSKWENANIGLAHRF